MALSESDILDVRFNDDGTPFIGQNGFEFVRGVEGVAWLCRVAILLFVGEWFLDRAKGMPWRQEILGVVGVDLGLVRTRVAQVLGAVTGVSSVTSVIVTLEERHLSIQVSVQTVFGVAAQVIFNLTGVISSG